MRLTVLRTNAVPVGRFLSLLAYGRQTSGDLIGKLSLDCVAVASFSAAKLDERTSPRAKHSYVDLLFCVVEHSIYHTGQTSLLKRLA